MQHQTSVFEPARFEAHGTLPVAGEEISYKVISEDNLFYKEDGTPIASIFSYSYFREDVEHPQTRPVCFVFNGGPGSSCMMLHTGFFSVKRLDYKDVLNPPTVAPFPLIDNPCSLLDIMDLVMVDPVGTGFGRLLDESAAGQFYSIEQDAEAFLHFVEQWLVRYDRWLSPRYLAGESYGTTRAVMAAGLGAAGTEHRSYGITFDGLVLIGNTVTDDDNCYRYWFQQPVAMFPTIAATNWYHNHPTQQPLSAFVDEAWQFAVSQYLPALYLSDGYPAEKREALLDRLCYYTGMTREYLTEHNLNINGYDVLYNVIHDRAADAGLYDGRFSLPKHTARGGEYNVIADDPCMGLYTPYFTAAVNGVLRKTLNITFDRAFISSNKQINKTWDRSFHGRSTAQWLVATLRLNADMRVLFANGYYDFCTLLGVVYNTVNRSGLPKDRVEICAYEAGHMAYLGEDNAQKLSDDIRRFVLHRKEHA